MGPSNFVMSCWVSRLDPARWQVRCSCLKHELPIIGLSQLLVASKAEEKGRRAVFNVRRRPPSWTPPGRSSRYLFLTLIVFLVGGPFVDMILKL